MHVIFGGGGFAREVEWLLQERGGSPARYMVLADGDAALGTPVHGIDTLAESHFLAGLGPEPVQVYLAIGAPAIRRKIAARLAAYPQLSFPSLIHPGANFDRRPGRVRYGRGCIVCANAVLTTDIQLGNFVHIDMGATVGHEAQIADYVRISPGANVSGRVRIGEAAFVGAGAVILERLNVAPEVLIGAGAVLIHDALESGTYVGVPARRLA